MACLEIHGYWMSAKEAVVKGSAVPNMNKNDKIVEKEYLIFEIPKDVPQK